MSNQILVILVIVVLAIAGLASYGVIESTKSTSTSQASTSANTITNVVGTGYTDTNDVTLQAGGSSFVNPIMQVWIDRFAGYTDGKVSINYESIGSAAGQQGLFDGSFNYAGSDAPVTAAQLANYTGKTLLQIPESLGAVTIFYNVPPIGNVSLKLTGPILAGIWNESITKWNDPAITALNPGIALPDQTIIPVHRADGSGTTYAFTTYLSKIDPTWNSTIGVGLIVNWPTNELAGTGSAGVAADVQNTPYSIAYADQYYAKQNGLAVAQVENSAGNFISPTLAAIESAANDFSTQLQSNPLTSISDAPGANSYPISTFTYLLVWKDQTDPNAAYAMFFFFWWIVNQGQGYGTVLGFPSLPQNIVTIDNGLISQINYNGQTYTAP